MRRFGLLALLLAALFAPLTQAADDEETRPVSRHLVDLYLGDRLEDARKLYPPTQDWPSYVEPKGHVNRIRIERTYTKAPARGVDVMWLGFKRNRLVEIQLIYDAQYTHDKPVDALAQELSLVYGNPRQSESKYWWADGKTVLRVFNAEVPMLRGGQKVVELRTSLQLLDAGLFHL